MVILQGNNQKKMVFLQGNDENIGISLSVAVEYPKAPVYIDVEVNLVLKGSNIAEEFKTILNEYIFSKYSI